MFDVQWPDVPTWVTNWAKQNRCEPNATDSVVATDVTHGAYANCADDVGVLLYTVHGGGHSWPGGMTLPEWFVGPTSSSIDATSTMWAFFREHRLRQR
jgi:polyhydroxybutyrate depolymerase